jgi:3-methyladenine DNA glycosylase/8-oxoguanine DNA glycosylase
LAADSWLRDFERVPEWDAAAEHLARRDAGLARVVEAAGPPRLRRRHGTPFESLVRSITFQQLAGRAAATIHGRFRALVDGDLTPAAVVALDPEAMRAAGLSAAKTVAIRELATKFADGTVPMEDVDRLTDDEIVSRLVSVRGIGRWTVEMFLIFQLRRPNVWPVDDLGVRKGFAIAHRLPAPPPPRDMAAAGDPYRPWRSVAAWYCWRANDTTLPD